MCLRAACVCWERGNTVLPSLERRGPCRKKVQWIMSKKHQWPSTAGSDCLSGVPGKREKQATQKHVHIVFTPWRNSWYAESQKCMLVILKGKTQWCFGQKEVPSLFYTEDKYFIILLKVRLLEGISVDRTGNIWSQICCWCWKSVSLFFFRFFSLSHLQTKSSRWSMIHELQAFSLWREETFSGAHITRLGFNSPPQLTQAAM